MDKECCPHFNHNVSAKSARTKYYTWLGVHRALPNGGRVGKYLPTNTEGDYIRENFGDLVGYISHREATSRVTGHMAFVKHRGVWQLHNHEIHAIEKPFKEAITVLLIKSNQ